MLDNQAAYNMCINNLKIQNPDFTDLNRIIAQVVSACTTSLRYESELNASLLEMVTNLVPQKNYRYAILSLSPVRPPTFKRHESNTTAEIITDLFEDQNILCGCTHLKQNRYLAAVVLLRGVDKKAAVVDMRDNASSGGISDAMGRSGGVDGAPPPIQVVDARWALHKLCNPAGGHRQPIRFLPWLEGSGFKVGIVAKPPVIPEENFMADSDRQGAMVGNSTSVRQMFVRQYTKFLKLFFHKCYFHHFAEFGYTDEDFEEAKLGVRDLIDFYETLLGQCVDYENQKLADVKVMLKGATRITQPPPDMSRRR
jgi:tubulin alpha